jgi:TonB-dependent SusC/RagA subfamily outer membrane receptor
LCFVDGKRVATIEGIDPNTIESVSVLKDKSATELYGKDAKDGVILIVLKKEAK